MRSGEILSLTPELITGSVALLPRTKNDSKRDVPLSKRALEILSELPVHAASAPYFNVSDESRDSLFRKQLLALESEASLSTMLDMRPFQG